MPETPRRGGSFHRPANPRSAGPRPGMQRQDGSRRAEVHPDARRPAAKTSWDALASWYNGWVGEAGSEHHRELAIPAVMRLLDLKPGERVLDIGAGQGVLAPAVRGADATYVGVDASPRLAQMARQHHGRIGTFLVGDALALQTVRGLEPGSFDAVVFLLSLQDMNPMEPALQSAAWALRPWGRAVLLLTHPAFRVPRQSGWGWDEGRKLVYRRVDRYLTPLPVPLKPYPGNTGVTRSFHRPLHMYINGLADAGLWTDRMDEIAAHKLSVSGAEAKAERTARREFPLFLGLRAIKVEAPARFQD